MLIIHFPASAGQKSSTLRCTVALLHRNVGKLYANIISVRRYGEEKVVKCRDLDMFQMGRTSLES